MTIASCQYIHSVLSDSPWAMRESERIRENIVIMVWRLEDSLGNGHCRGLNSGFRAWQHMPLPAGAPCLPSFEILKGEGFS